MGVRSIVAALAGPGPLRDAWSRASSALVLGVLPAFLLAAGSAEAGAQSTIAEVAAECGGGAAEWTEWCREVALAGQAARAGFGLLASGAAEVPGSAGTLGWRLGSVPRISVGARVVGARVPAAELGTTMRSPLPADPLFAQAIHVNAGVGLFDGFSPAPTVGGLLSLDLVGTGGFLLLPGNRGFGGSSSAYGAGVRLGVLRESFTLPALSISAVRRWSGEVTVAGTGQGGVEPRLAFEPTTTSIRATAGKDLVAVGVLAGVGWERYGGSFRVVPDAGADGGGAAAGSVTTDDLEDSRFLAFGGASLNFLILQLSAEVGWAAGLEPLAGRSPGDGFDPTDASWFGGLGARLTY